VDKVKGRISVNGKKTAYIIPEIFKAKRYKQGTDDDTESILIVISCSEVSNEDETDFNETDEDAEL
jgi:hypothetical protein